MSVHHRGTSHHPRGAARAIALIRDGLHAAKTLSAGLLVVLLVLAACELRAPASDEAPLFNGRDLVGWTPAGSAAHWKVEGGAIVGENADKKGSVLWTRKEFGDFELELEFMTPSADYDSGIFLRGKSHQVQIGISRSLKKDLTACIYAPKDGKGGYPAISEKVAQVHKPGDWNRLRIVVRGKRIQTFLNGQAFVDYEGSTLPSTGPIGLQLHGNVHMTMRFRNLRLGAPGE